MTDPLSNASKNCMESSMRVTLDDDFLTIFPEASIHLLVCRNVPAFSTADVEPWEDRARVCVEASGIKRERLSEGAEFQEWRTAYAKFGLKPSKFQSSVEQLWKRALQGRFIHTPVKLVDLYCHMSLIARVPMGGYDLDHVAGDLRVRLAEQGEQFFAIGETESLSVPKGVVVYADDSGVVCFAWNHRDSARTCLRPETQRAVFFADSATRESGPRAVEGLDLLAGTLKQSGCEVSRELLDRNRPAVEITL